MSEPQVMSVNELDWQTEKDIEALLRGDVIRKDPKRLAAAQKLAQERIEEATAVKSLIPKSPK